MRVCYNCGYIFEDSDLGHYGECPKCGHDDTDEAERCPICGEYHNGFFDGNAVWCCSECFQKALTPENFLKYATSGAEYPEEMDTLEDFTMCEVFRLEPEQKHSSYEFKAHCEEIYDGLVERGEVGDLIKDYFYRVPDMYGCFTEWLVDEHKKEAKT